MQTVKGKITFDGWLGLGVTNTINSHVHKFQLRRFGVLLGENTISMIGQTNTSTFSFTTNFNVGVGSTNNLDGSYKGDMWLRATKSITYNSGDGIYYFNNNVPVIVKAGDTVEDNTVDIGDYAVFSAAYGSVPADGNWNKLADYDGDDEVSVGDYGIFNANYGLFGDE